MVGSGDAGRGCFKTHVFDFREDHGGGFLGTEIADVHWRDKVVPEIGDRYPVRRGAQSWPVRPGDSPAPRMTSPAGTVGG